MTQDEVWIVEDDIALADSLSLLLSSNQNHAVRLFKTAIEFTAAIHGEAPKHCGCILMDIRLPDGNGHSLFELFQTKKWYWPVIFMTGHGDVESAVKLMHKGAYDYVLKPYDTFEFLNKIQDSLDHCKEAMVKRDFIHQYEQQIKSLSPQEKRVYEGILALKTSRELAEETSISTRTIEIHRSHMFKKMHVSSAVELAKKDERFQLEKSLLFKNES